MPPITWRNVAGANTAAGNDLLKAGVAQIQAGIKGGVGLVQDLGAEQDAGELARIKTLLQGSTVEEAQALADAGFQGGIGDETAITNLLNAAPGRAVARENELFQREQNQITQENTVRAQGEKEGRDNIAALIARGDLEGARTAIDESGIRDTASIEKSLFGAGERAETEQRSDDANARLVEQQGREDLFRRNTEGLETQGRQLADTRTSRIEQARVLQTSFAEANPGVTFDGSGNISLPKGLNPVQASELLSQYEAARAQGPQIRTLKQQVSEIRKYSADNNATREQEDAAVRNVESRYQESLQLSDEDTVLLADATQSAKDTFFAANAQSKITLQAKLDQYAVDAATTAKMEDARGGNSVQPGELIQDEIAQLVSTGDALVSDIGDDDEGINEITDAMNSAVSAGFTRGTVTEPFPGWVVRAAYKSVGLRTMYRSDTFSTDKTDANPFKAALNRVMKEHLRAENNSLLAAQAQSDFAAKSFQQTQRLRNQQKSAGREARERSNIFTEDDNSNVRTDLDFLTRLGSSSN